LVVAKVECTFAAKVVSGLTIRPAPLPDRLVGKIERARTGLFGPNARRRSNELAAMTKTRSAPFLCSAKAEFLTGCSKLMVAGRYKLHNSESCGLFSGFSTIDRAKLLFPTRLFRRLAASFATKPSQGIATIDFYFVPRERTGCSACPSGIIRNQKRDARKIIDPKK
jgi:hypothetical protein